LLFYLSDKTNNNSYKRFVGRVGLSAETFRVAAGRMLTWLVTEAISLMADKKSLSRNCHGAIGAGLNFKRRTRSLLRVVTAYGPAPPCRRRRSAINNVTMQAACPS